MTTYLIFLSLLSLLSLIALARGLHRGVSFGASQPPRSHEADEFARTGSTWH